MKRAQYQLDLTQDHVDGRPRAKAFKACRQGAARAASVAARPSAARRLRYRYDTKSGTVQAGSAPTRPWLRSPPSAAPGHPPAASTTPGRARPRDRRGPAFIGSLRCRCASSPPAGVLRARPHLHRRGAPAGLGARPRAIDRDMARRQLGHGRGGRMKIEKDAADVTAGVRHGRTLGGPVSLTVANRDYANWEERMNLARSRPTVPRCTRRAPATPTSPACRSTASPTSATCSSAPSARETAAARSRRALAKAFLRASGSRSSRT